jgi:hypothetical protein
MIRTSWIHAAALVLAVSGLACAQSTTGGAPPTTTTTPSTTTPGATPTAQAPIDLPLAEPAFAAEKNPPPPNVDKGNDDPRDKPPPTLYGEEIPNESDTIFYVIDCSCSMDWDNQSYTTMDGHHANGPRIERAKCELIRSITGLSANFKFNIVSYGCESRMWQQSMVPADDSHKAAGIAYVQALQPDGATGTGPAMALALGTDRSNKSVVLLTDGAPNCGTPNETMAEHRAMIRGANTQHATISVFGIAASGSYRAFCQNVAADGGGSYFDVP